MNPDMIGVGGDTKDLRTQRDMDMFRQFGGGCGYVSKEGFAPKGGRPMPMLDPRTRHDQEMMKTYGGGCSSGMQENYTPGCGYSQLSDNPYNLATYVVKN